MTGEVIIAVGIMVGLGTLFAVILAVAYKKLRVYEDPRISAVEEMLPNTNCGACGQPGCRAFAETLVSGENKPSQCTVSSPEGIDRIADYLGVEAGEAEKKVARLLCAGGQGEAHHLADYKGSMSTCRAEAVVAGGALACSWGCLGLGDCMQACDFDAIFMNEDGLPQVRPELCTACGDCVEVCPRDLFELMPVSQKLIVQCKSLLKGELAESKCSVACNACGRCVADAPDGLIRMEDNLAVIDYSMNELSSPAATRRCPTGAIQWVEWEQFKPEKSTGLPIGRVEQYSQEDEA